MCYTARDSINSFLAVIISGTIILSFISYTELRIAIIYLMFVGIMQLFDYILWKNIPPSIINKIVTKFAIITLHIQPLILALLILLYKKKLGYYSKIAILLYTIIVIPYTIYCLTKVNYTDKNPLGYGLEWKWNTLNGMGVLYISYLLTIILLIIENFKGYLKYLLFVIFIGSYIFSLWKYYIYNVGGRFWCNYSGFIPIILLICHIIYLGIIKYRKK